MDNDEKKSFEQKNPEPRHAETRKEPAADKMGLLALIIFVIAIVAIYFIFKPQPASVPAVTTPTPTTQVAPTTNDTQAVP